MKSTFILVLIILAVGVDGGPTSLNTCLEITDGSTYCERASSWMCEFVNYRKLSNEWKDMMERIRHNRECDSTAPSTVAETSTGAATTPQRPTSTVPELVTTNQPTAMVPELTTTNQPTTTVPELITTNQPTTMTPEPTTTNQPTTMTPEPTTTNQPTTMTPEPTTSNQPRTIAPATGNYCSQTCLGIRIGSIANQPIALVTEGSAAKIFPDFAPDGVDVYCDCRDGPDGAWTVFQRRMDGSVDFYRNWTDYINGFGNLSGEFWLGLDAISNFTSGGGYELRVDLEDWDNNTAYATYSTFSVADSSTNYTLTVDEYEGTAGDSFRLNGTSYHNGQQFSTPDRDNDMADGVTFDGDCAQYFAGAWWFKSCFSSHLNGEYSQGPSEPDGSRGIIWFEWKGWEYSLKTVEMKIRKK